MTLSAPKRRRRYLLLCCGTVEYVYDTKAERDAEAEDLCGSGHDVDTFSILVPSDDTGNLSLNAAS